MNSACRPIIVASGLLFGLILVCPINGQNRPAPAKSARQGTEITNPFVKKNLAVAKAPSWAQDQNNLAPANWSAPTNPPSAKSKQLTLQPPKQAAIAKPSAFQLGNLTPTRTERVAELTIGAQAGAAPRVGNFPIPDLETPAIPDLNGNRAPIDSNRGDRRSLIRQPVAFQRQATHSTPNGQFRAVKFGNDGGKLQLASPGNNQFLGGLPRQRSAANSFPIQSPVGQLALTRPTLQGQVVPASPAIEQGRSAVDLFQPINGGTVAPSVGSGGKDLIATPTSQGCPLGANLPPTANNPAPGFGYQNPVQLQPAPVYQSQIGLPLLPNYRQDLGHRAPGPTYRGRDFDNGQTFDFEDKKKDYPPLGEILATGRYFGSFSLLFWQPSFQGNSPIASLNAAGGLATFGSAEAIDFDYETAPRFRFGFESRFGPGIELDYWQFDQGSNVSSFTSDGTTFGQLSATASGPGLVSTLRAANAGETLSAIHSIDVETFSALIFKEIKFPISRLNGMFGFQYASIFQSLDADLTDASGTVLGDLTATSDLRAWGPKFKFEYYRPVGHTKLEFVTSFGGAALFGQRDEIVTNSQGLTINRFAADELVLTSEFYGGIQFKKLFAENRGVYGRFGFNFQTWIGGGTAIDAQDDFGLRGIAFEIGYNR